MVELTYYHGCAYREIAQIVGCPVDTVKTRMFHARRKEGTPWRGGGHKMSLRLFRTDDPSERETEALLAWYVNGTLDTSSTRGTSPHRMLALSPRGAEAARIPSGHDAGGFCAGLNGRSPARTRDSTNSSNACPAALVQRLAKSWRAAPSVVRGALAVQLVLIIGLGLA